MSLSLACGVTRKDTHLFSTWQIFLMLVFANLLLAWVYNQQVLTREVYHHLFSESWEARRIDEYFDFMRRLSVWGYLVQPLLLGAQITFFSLLLQAPLLLMFVEIPLARIIRLITIASAASTLASAAQLLHLSCIPPEDLEPGMLQALPLSLASVIAPANYSRSAFWMLGKINLFELLWCALLYKGLSATGQIKKDQALFLAALFWLSLLLLQWGIVAYFEKIGS